MTDARTTTPLSDTGQAAGYDRELRLLRRLAALDGSVHFRWNPRNDHIVWTGPVEELTGIPPGRAPTTLAAVADRIDPADQVRTLAAFRRLLTPPDPAEQAPAATAGEPAGDDALTGLEVTVRGDAGPLLVRVDAAVERGPDGRATLVVGRIRPAAATAGPETARAGGGTGIDTDALFEHGLDAMLILDPTGIVVAANAVAGRLWSRPAESLRGHRIEDLTGPSAEPGGGNTLLVRGTDGTEIAVERHILNADAANSDGHRIVILRDITARERAERALRERDAELQLSSRLAAMGSLAAGVGHEINNPLAYILGNLTFVEEELTDAGFDHEVVEAVRECIDGARRVRDIVADLKAITRPDEDAHRCEPIEVVRITTRMAMADLRHRADLVTVAEAVPLAAIAASRLTQVLLNLLSNAAAAFADSIDTGRNRIEVAVGSGPLGVRIAVSDNGCGIAAADLEAVFEPFMTTKGADGGTGLGLAICRRIVEEAGGRITLSSVPGEGTTVLIDLAEATEAAPAAPESDTTSAAAAPAPAAPTPAAPAPAPAPAPESIPRMHLPVNAIAPSAPTRPRLMVIDDDELAAAAIERLLRVRYEVTVFTDPVAALGILTAADGPRFDAVLCDLMMPVLSGPALYGRLDLEAPEVARRMLFVTGGAVTEEAQRFEARMTEAGRLLHKPVPLRELFRLVDELVTN